MAAATGKKDWNPRIISASLESLIISGHMHVYGMSPEITDLSSRNTRDCYHIIRGWPVYFCFRHASGLVIRDHTLQLEMVIDNGHRDIGRLSFHSFFHSSNSAARCSLSNANFAPKSLPQRQHFKLLFR